MKFFIIALLFTSTHGINVAKFTIDKKETKVLISINIEAADLSEALHTPLKEINKTQIEKYLKNNMVYHINDDLTTYSVRDFKLHLDHFTITTVIDQEIGTIKNLQIKNTTFFEVNDDQSNIIELRFNGMFRDFLIDKNKPTLLINL